MPHNAVDPVVLCASIVLRLQTIVSRETQPGQFAVVTVGASNAGSKSNIIPDRGELLLNLRTYDTALRERIMAAIERIVRGECAAAGSPGASSTCGSSTHRARSWACMKDISRARYSRSKCSSASICRCSASRLAIRLPTESS